MMMNKAILTGRMVKDPSLKESAAGVPVCRFSIAVTQKGKEKKADFFPVVCFHGTAEFVKKYFAKGQPVTLCGSLQNREWEETDGTRRRVTEILAREIYFCGGAQKSAEGREQSTEGRA